MSFVSATKANGLIIVCSRIRRQPRLGLCEIQSWSGNSVGKGGPALQRDSRTAWIAFHRHTLGLREEGWIAVQQNVWGLSALLFEGKQWTTLHFIASGYLYSTSQRIGPTEAISVRLVPRIQPWTSLSLLKIRRNNGENRLEEWKVARVDGEDDTPKRNRCQ